MVNLILHVARLFPVIRFDAAMTLASVTFIASGFPVPGSELGHPSRAEYGMNQAGSIAPCRTSSGARSSDGVARRSTRHFAPRRGLLADGGLLHGYCHLL